MLVNRGSTRATHTFTRDGAGEQRPRIPLPRNDARTFEEEAK